jgi:hypothetical protein
MAVQSAGRCFSTMLHNAYSIWNIIRLEIHFNTLVCGIDLTAVAHGYNISVIGMRGLIWKHNYSLFSNSYLTI